MFCADNCILVQYEPGIKINPLSCNRWSCPDCCEKRKSRLRSEAYRGRPNTFITLTVNPEVGENPADRAQKLVNAWRKVRRRAKYLCGNVRVPFIAVFEETEKGEPHLHILSRLKWIPQDWLSDQMKAEIGAPIVDIRRISSRRAASRYVSKYIGKSPEKYAGCKRYWRSLDYLIEPRKERIDPIGERTSQWFERGLTMEIAKRYTRKFYRLEVVATAGPTEFWLVNDWYDFGGKRPPPHYEGRTAEDRQPQEPGLGAEEGGLFSCL